jgi:hypothetical protein
MKKLMVSLLLMLAIAASANAMNSSDARVIARFLTDKMAYELNLTEDQYEAAFEVNYDYFLNLDDYNDLYSTYWTRRNLDLSYILGSAKYLRFKALSYFFRPAYWSNSRMHYRIYSRYTNRNRYYFSNPDDYSNYNSEHSWKANNNRSYYKGRDFDNGTGMRSSMRGNNNNSNNNYNSNNSSRNGFSIGNNGNNNSSRNGNYSNNNNSNYGNGNSNSNRNRNGNSNNSNRNRNNNGNNSGNSRNGNFDNTNNGNSNNGNSNNGGLRNGNNNSNNNSGTMGNARTYGQENVNGTNNNSGNNNGNSGNSAKRQFPKRK